MLFFKTENEDELNKFANAANKRVLLVKEIGDGEHLRKLLEFSGTWGKPETEKRRKRTETERLKESKEQEDVTSPKKKPKDKKQDEAIKKTKEKKKKESSAAEQRAEKKKREKVSFIAEKEILSDLSTQFCEEKEETPLTTTWRLCNPSLGPVATNNYQNGELKSVDILVMIKVLVLIHSVVINNKLN